MHPVTTTKCVIDRIALACRHPLATIAALAILLPGCMSLQPRSSSASAPDANGVISYQTPSFDNRITWAGWVSIGAMTVGGAAAGYTSDISFRWDGWERPSEIRPAGNATLGALLGLTSSVLITLLVGGNTPPVTTANTDLWARKLAPDYLVVRIDSSTTGTVSRVALLPRAAETTFAMHSLDDARFYASAFPASPHTSEIVSAAVPAMPRTALPALAAMFPALPAVSEATARYIRESPSFDSALSAATRFPEHRDLAEHRAAELIRNPDHLRRFAMTFPSSTLRDSVAERIAPSITRDDIPKFLELFPGIESSAELKRKFVDSSTTTGEAIQAGRQYPELRAVSESRAAALARSVRNFREYLSAFPSGEHASEMIARMNEVLSRPEVLSTAVNTRYHEVLPVISPDGKNLFFSRKYSPDNTGGSSDPDEIWLSELDSNGLWKQARQIGLPINKSGPDHLGAVTPDGNTVLLGTAYDGTLGFSMSERTADGWGYPNTLDITNYYNLAHYIGGYYLTNDGKALLFSIQRRDSRGGLDLYASFLRPDGSWTEPMNLGTTLNTKQDEDAPFLAADGVTLYFSSRGHGGYGGNDVLMTRRLDNTWKKWSKPVNLGPTINSSEDESFFFIPASGDYAYFSSDRFSPGDMDIVRIGVPESARPRPVVLVAGRVLDQSTNRPVDARVVYETLADGKEIGVARTDPKTGVYKIALPSGTAYGFRAEADGFIAVSDNLDLTNLSAYSEQSRDLYLVPIELGQIVRLNNLFFDVGKATLRRESLPELNRMVSLMTANPMMTVEITGHTDNIGSDENNLLLSRNRADAVLNYLASHGVPATRVSSRGLGKSSPVASNDTEEGRQRNRRVEFRIITK
jgi:outer membrane protein OmpA-like peptidoglycan-associated protein